MKWTEAVGDVNSLIFFLLCSANFVRNSFCFASKDATPLGVMSPNEGVRDRDVDDVNGRIALMAGIELEALATRRASIVLILRGGDVGNCLQGAFKRYSRRRNGEEL